MNYQSLYAYLGEEFQKEMLKLLKKGQLSASAYNAVMGTQLSPDCDCETCQSIFHSSKNQNVMPYENCHPKWAIKYFDTEGNIIQEFPK